jgi:Kp4
MYSNPTKQSATMRSLIPAGLFILAALLSPASALGINCRGAAAYDLIRSSVARNLADFINGIDQECWHQNGEQIACDEADQKTGDNIYSSNTKLFCAFLQNTGGVWGSDILRYIPDHGCKAVEATLISIHRTTTSSMGNSS